MGIWEAAEIMGDWTHVLWVKAGEHVATTSDLEMLVGRGALSGKASLLGEMIIGGTVGVGSWMEGSRNPMQVGMATEVLFRRRGDIGFWIGILVARIREK